MQLTFNTLGGHIDLYFIVILDGSHGVKAQYISSIPPPIYEFDTASSLTFSVLWPVAHSQPSPRREEKANLSSSTPRALSRSSRPPPSCLQRARRSRLGAAPLSNR
jgi:hypothetical protein